MRLWPYKSAVSIEAASKDMTVLATLKSELGITAITDDALLGALIQQASAQMVNYCNREFASETLVDNFRRDRANLPRTYTWRSVETIDLSRTPVTSITSIVEDGTALSGTTDYEYDGATGRVWRLDGTDNRIGWTGFKITVTFVAGYVLLTELPQELERVCIDLAKMHWFARKRDPSLKESQVVDVGAERYALRGVDTGGIPQEAADVLDTYRRIEIGA